MLGQLPPNCGSVTVAPGRRGDPGLSPDLAPPVRIAGTRRQKLAQVGLIRTRRPVLRPLLTPARSPGQRPRHALGRMTRSGAATRPLPEAGERQSGHRVSTARARHPERLQPRLCLRTPIWLRPAAKPDGCVVGAERLQRGRGHASGPSAPASLPSGFSHGLGPTTGFQTEPSRRARAAGAAAARPAPASAAWPRRAPRRTDRSRRSSSSRCTCAGPP